MLANATWRAYCRFKGVESHWSELSSFPILRPDEARRKMAARLHAQIRYFGTRADGLPEWQAAAAIRDPDELWEAWPSLPILTKRDLQTRFHPQEMSARCGITGTVDSTGGSTGEPTPFLHDDAMLQATFSARWYARWQLGWRPNLATICIWGSERDIGNQMSLRGRASRALHREWLVDGYALDEATVDTVVALVRRHPATAIYGFTSMLAFVARRVLARGDAFPEGRVRCAWTAGEALSEAQHRLFREAFGAPLLNYYGGRELSSMAYQPRIDEPLRLLRPLLFVETVNDEGKPVEPGQPGRLIWTSTACRGTPFIRYDIGDIGTAEEHDRDESGIHSLTTLQGRSTGLLQLPNGKVIHNIFWNHLFKEFTEIEQFQVAIGRDDEITLRLLPRLGEERERQLRANLGHLLGGLEVRIDYVNKIPLTHQGKLLQVVREP